MGHPWLADSNEVMYRPDASGDGLVETITSGGTASASLAMGPESAPVAVFADNHGTFFTDHLQFARRRTGVWTTEEIVLDPTPPNITSTASAVDAQGNLHILANMGTLTYVYEGLNGWTVDSLDERGTSQTIAIDSAGLTHIAWASTDGVKHAVCDQSP